jgi:hypothetical protein
MPLPPAFDRQMFNHSARLEDDSVPRLPYPNGEVCFLKVRCAGKSRVKTANRSIYIFPDGKVATLNPFYFF